MFLFSRLVRCCLRGHPYVFKLDPLLVESLHLSVEAVLHVFGLLAHRQHVLQGLGRHPLPSGFGISYDVADCCLQIRVVQDIHIHESPSRIVRSRLRRDRGCTLVVTSFVLELVAWDVWLVFGHG